MTVLKQLLVGLKTFLPGGLNRQVVPFVPRAIGHLRSCYQYSEWSTTKKGLTRENDVQAGRNEAVLYVHVSKITRVLDPNFNIFSMCFFFQKMIILSLSVFSV